MASRTQVRFQMVSGSFPAGTESAYAARAISGMTETNHGSLKDTLGYLAASIQRIHGASDWINSAAGTFAHDVVPDADGSRDLGNASAEWAEVHANALKSATALDIDAAAGVTIDGTTVSIGGTDDADMTIVGSGKNLDVAVTGGGDQHLRFASAGTSADALKLNASAGGIDIDANSTVAIDAAQAISLTGAGINLAGGSSEVDITTSGALDLNVGSVDLDSSAGVAIDGTAVSIDGTDSSNFTMTGNSSSDVTMTIAATNSGSGAGVLDIDAGDAITVDAGAGLSLQGGAASDLTTGAGALTLDGAGGVNIAGNSAEIDITTSGALDMNAAAVTVDGTSISIDGSDAMNFSMAANSSGNLSLDIDAANSGSGTAGIRIGTTAATGIAIGASVSEVVIGDNLTVTGDLTVSGDTTTVNTANLLVEDPVILLASGASSQDQNGGIVLEKGGSSSDADMVFGRVAADTWAVGTKDTSGGTATTLADMTLGPLRAGKLEIDGASDHIDMSGGNLVITAGTSDADILLDPAGSDVKVDGNVVPNADDGGSLGSANLNWSDMYLADAAVLNFGDDQDVNLTHVADTGLLLNAGMQLQFRDADIHISSDADGALQAKADSQIDFAIGSTGDIASVRSGGLMPGSDNARALGATSLAWSDLYLGDGAVIRVGPSSYGATLTHTKHDRFGSDIKDDRLTSSFSALQTSNIVGSTLTSSDSTISFSPNVGISIDGGTVIVFQDSSSNKLAFTASSTSSGDSSISVSYNSAASTSGVTSMSVSSISNALKDHGTVASAMNESSVTGSTTSLTFPSADAAQSFNNKVGSNATFQFIQGSVTAEMELASYSSGSTLSFTGAATLSGGSSVSMSSLDTVRVKASDQAQKLTLDGNYASLNLADHDGAGYGLELAGTLVTATATELNLLDGGTYDSSSDTVTLAGTDGFIVNDDGTMKFARIADIASFFATGRSKKSTTVGVSGISAGAVTTVSGMAHDLGADPDITDVYLNGQLMLSGSSSSSGDYRINGTGPDSSTSGMSSITITNSGLNSDVTSVTLSAQLNSANTQFAAGKVLVLENSAGDKRFEGTIASTPSSSATSIAITAGTARAFVPATGVAITGTDFAGSQVGSSGKKIADPLTSDDVIFHFALEGDDVVTITKNG